MPFIHYHPYEPFINKDTKKLIVGTLPPPRFSTGELKDGDVDIQYGSKDNLLWKLLDKIFDLDLVFKNSDEAVNQRKEFLKKYQIGICDMVKFCSREKVDASDLGMGDIVLRDILFYLKEFKEIDTILFMGASSKNSPEYFFRKVLKENGIKFEKVSDEIPRVHKFSFERRKIKTISLTSPSNAANRSIGANLYYKQRKNEDSNYSTFDFRLEQYERVFRV